MRGEKALTTPYDGVISVLNSSQFGWGTCGFETVDIQVRIGTVTAGSASCTDCEPTQETNICIQ